MSNPFYIPVSSAAGSGPSVLAAGGRALGAGIRAKQEARQAKYEEGIALEKNKALVNDFQDAFRSGDTARLADLAAQNPDVSKRMQESFGITNKETEAEVKGSYTSALSSDNPIEAANILEAASKRINSFGGNTKNMQINIEGLKNGSMSLKDIESNAAVMYPDLHKAWKGAQDKPIAYKDTRTAKERHYESWLDMPEGAKKDKYAEVFGITKAGSASDATKEVAKATELKDATFAASNLKTDISNFLGNKKFMESVSGLSGRMPTVTTGGTDAGIALEHIVTNLMLKNMGIMKGVLNDRDMEIIRAASSGIGEGMSEGALRKSLNRIVSIIDRKLVKEDKPSPEPKEKQYQRGRGGNRRRASDNKNLSSTANKWLK